MDDANQIPAAAAPSSTGTDWLRLATMSDEDIARAVTNDPDAAPILDAERMRREYHPHAARLP